MAKPPAAAKAFNRVAVKLAGHRLFPPWAVLRHHGRKSGVDYATPVVVFPGDGIFLIGLPWGRGTDWVRNLRAAGGCTVRWRGIEWQCTDPGLVDGDEAVALTKGLARLVVSRSPLSEFLRLERRRA